MATPQGTEVQEKTIHLTPPAMEQVRELIQERNLSGYALRVFVAGQSCSGLQYGLALEGEPRENDHHFSFDDVELVVDPVSIEYMHGATIDYIDGPTGAGFQINNPSFTASCGSSGCSSCA